MTSQNDTKFRENSWIHVPVIAFSAVMTLAWVGFIGWALASMLG